jgi:hypothetical protein
MITIAFIARRLLHADNKNNDGLKILGYPFN